MSVRRHVVITVEVDGAEQPYQRPMCQTHNSGEPTPAGHAWCEDCNILLPRVDKRNPAKVVPIMLSTPTMGILCPDCREKHGERCYIQLEPTQP